MMMCRTWLLGFILLGAICSKKVGLASERSNAIATISHAGTLIKIQTDIGARVVEWRVGDSVNLLDGGKMPTLRRLKGWPEPVPHYQNQLGRGFTVWLGPQSEWWTDQELLLDKKKQKAIWPPDPILTLAPYRVIDHQSNKITLESPVSLFTGIRLIKSFKIDDGGLVHVHVAATNKREKPVTRNLWFNFRADATGQEYVPLKKSAPVRYEHHAKPLTTEGFHSLLIKEAQIRAKAFLVPAEGLMASTVPGGLITLRFEATAPSEVPEGHAPVEIFRSQDVGKLPLLELENHGPLETLQPNETMEMSITWEYVSVSARDLTGYTEWISYLRAKLSLGD